MKRHLVYISVLVAGLMFGLVSAALGNTRAAGMGGAYTAVADDGSAPLYNPAGIVQIRYPVLFGMKGSAGDTGLIYSLLDGKTTGYPVFHARDSELTGFSTKNIALSYLGDFTGLFESNLTGWHGEAFGFRCQSLTVADTFGDHWAVGLNLKMVNIQTTIFDYSVPNEKLVTASGSGMAGDLGVLYQTGDTFKVGFAARNVFSQISWTDVQVKLNGTLVSTSGEFPTDLPQTFALGIACYPSKSLLVATDIELKKDHNSKNENTTLRMGLEQKIFRGLMALRVGAVSTNNVKDLGMTAGLGLKFGPALVDLAVVNQEETGIYLTAGLKL
jgi:hypothetical protein